MTIEFQPASAADDCLTKPAGTPAGKHWFYRIDRTTKRQCWYLRDDDRAAQGASLVTRKLASEKERAKLSSSAADAHAEFQSPASQTSDDVKIAASTPPTSAPPVAGFPPVAAFPAPAVPAVTPPVASAPAVSPPHTVDSAASDSAVATRWPDSSGTLQTSAEPPPRASSYTLAAASADAAPAETAAPVAPAPIAADSQLTAAVGSASDDAARTRLFAFLGAVAVAGFSTSVLLARARAKRQLRIEPVAARRVTRWPVEPELDRMHLPPVESYYPGLAPRGKARSQPTSQVSVVPRDDVRYDEQYEVEDLLARYSGQPRPRS
ncbi:hypothetical protein [Bradyrhizobium ontarionense]|uniref:hypothetical protein n=1 Tax=Bradyrhizobium ontarionense TaxID=2898149 RepID=UPI0031F316A0